MALMRPAVPGTAWIADHFPSFASREKAVVVIESGVFFAPIPMKEKSKTSPWTLSMATALFETGSGSGSTPESPNRNPLKTRTKRDAESFLMDSNRRVKCNDKNITARLIQKLLPTWKETGQRSGPRLGLRLECRREAESAWPLPATISA